MAKLGAIYIALTSSAVDVLDGFEPGTYDVTLVAFGSAWLGGSDLDSTHQLDFPSGTERKFTVSPGELFASSPGSGSPSIKLIAVPRVD